MPNRLAAETSPYLLQHAHNPVEWWPWGPEAFAEAERLDKPVLLSVGYAACHWCHVMAHESFEHPGVAEVMNELFVNVKVDREERPDVDAVYMDAVTAMSGHGGWPMTCFLTGSGAPFFAGTYFPRDAFVDLLRRGAAVYRERRDDVLAQGQALLDELGRRAAVPGGAEPPTDADLAAAAGALLAGYDSLRGGFGDAPKFPPSMCLEFLLRHHARTGDAAALAAVVGTAEAMARGGLYDQLGGGFARYSVDASWVVPHFEKMLYDNALLARVYAGLSRVTDDPLPARVARETCAFLLAELRTPEAAFASSLDADTDGAEGRFYVWTPAEVGPWVADLCAVTAAGTFEHGTSVLQLRRDPADPARWAAERARLRAVRDRRTRPGRDDKVVASWNGLAIAALATCGELFGEPALVAAAAAAADLVLRVHRPEPGGPLRRVSRDGVAGSAPGALEDYANLAEGLLVLHQVDGQRRWLDAALDLLDTADRLLRGPAAPVATDPAGAPAAGDGAAAGGGPEVGGGPAGGAVPSGLLYDAEAAPAGPGALPVRPRDVTDNATPSGTSAYAGAQLTAAALTGDPGRRARAGAALAHSVPVVRSHPRFAGWAAAVGEAWLAGPVEVAVVGRPDLRAVAWRAAPGGSVVVSSATAAPPADAASPLVVGRPAGAAYVCRNFACDLPVTDEQALRRQLLRPLRA